MVTSDFRPEVEMRKSATKRMLKVILERVAPLKTKAIIRTAVHFTTSQ